MHGDTKCRSEMSTPCSDEARKHQGQGRTVFLGRAARTSGVGSRTGGWTQIVTKQDPAGRILQQPGATRSLPSFHFGVNSSGAVHHHFSSR